MSGDETTLSKMDLTNYTIEAYFRPLQSFTNFYRGNWGFLHDINLNPVYNPLFATPQYTLHKEMRAFQNGDVIGYVGGNGWWFVHSEGCIKLRNQYDFMQKDKQYILDNQDKYEISELLEKLCEYQK